MHTAVRAVNDARTKDMVGRRKRRGRGRDDLVCQQTPSGAQLPYLAVILAQFLTLILSTGDGARERQVRAAAAWIRVLSLSLSKSLGRRAKQGPRRHPPSSPY